MRISKMGTPKEGCADAVSELRLKSRKTGEEVVLRGAAIDRFFDNRNHADWEEA